MRRGMTLVEVLLGTSLLIATLAVSATLLLGLARDRQRIVDRTESLRTLDLALDTIDDAFTTVAVRAGALPGLVTSARSIRLHAAMDRPGIETAVPGRHVVSMQDDGVGISLTGLEGEGVIVPGMATLRVRTRHDGQWVDSFDTLETGGLPSVVVIDAWLLAEPDEDTPPDRRRILVIPGLGMEPT